MASQYEIIADDNHDIKCKKYKNRGKLGLKYGAIAIISILCCVAILYTMFFKLLAKPILTQDFKHMSKDGIIYIVVPCGPNDDERRDAIRRTWKKHLTKVTTMSFFVGSKNLDGVKLNSLRQEAIIHKDMVFFEEYEDSYIGLTWKMIEIYKYVVNLNINIKWVIKTDTDAWLNIYEIEKMLLKHEVQTVRGSYVPFGWPVSAGGTYGNNIYKNTNYPLFPNGGWYSMTYDIVEWIVDQDKRGWLQMMPNEDAALGIWLSGTPVRMETELSINPDGFLVGNSCQNNQSVVHHIRSDVILKFGKNFEECGQPCSCDT